VEEEILCQEDPDNIVESLAVNRISGVPLAGQDGTDLRLGRIDREGHHLGARPHDIVRALIVEFEHAAQHEGFARIQRASRPGLQHELAQLLDGERAHPLGCKHCGHGVQQPANRAPEGVMDGVENGGRLRDDARRGPARN
jgi:hypothetical protein